MFDEIWIKIWCPLSPTGTPSLVRELKDRLHAPNHLRNGGANSWKENSEELSSTLYGQYMSVNMCIYICMFSRLVGRPILVKRFQYLSIQQLKDIHNDMSVDMIPDQKTQCALHKHR
jgi:hypothetical protein